MEILEDGLEPDPEAFLARPPFRSLAQVSRAKTAPQVSPLWFRWEDGAVRIIAREGRSYPERVRRNPRTALAVVDFDPATGRIEHVGMRGRSSLEPYDEARAERLLASYPGDDRGGWPETFLDLDPEAYRLLRFEPETVVARDQSYPAADTSERVDPE